MSLAISSPSFRCCVGDADAFAIDILLPSLERGLWRLDASAVLEATSGLLTFFVGGVNVFRIDLKSPSASCDHVDLSLSMFLEWVWYDRAYRCDERSAVFSDVIAGESSPAVFFEGADGVVNIRWDLSEWRRGDARYATTVGSATITYRHYIESLALVVDTIVGACSLRCESVGCLPQWQAWLDGYRQEHDEFRRYTKQILQA